MVLVLCVFHHFSIIFFLISVFYCDLQVAKYYDVYKLYKLDIDFGLFVKY